MKILDTQISKKELIEMAEKMFGNLVKCVVDVEKEIVAIDSELHVDLAEMLVERGSSGKNLWGINIYPEKTDWLEFDSMINLKPNQENRSRNVEDPIMREKIETIIKHFVKL